MAAEACKGSLFSYIFEFCEPSSIDPLLNKPNDMPLGGIVCVTMGDTSRISFVLQKLTTYFNTLHVLMQQYFMWYYSPVTW